MASRGRTVRRGLVLLVFMEFVAMVPATVRWVTVVRIALSCSVPGLAVAMVAAWTGHVYATAGGWALTAVYVAALTVVVTISTATMECVCAILASQASTVISRLVPTNATRMVTASTGPATVGWAGLVMTVACGYASTTAAAMANASMDRASVTQHTTVWIAHSRRA
jgi:hypothetical protein